MGVLTGKIDIVFWFVLGAFAASVSFGLTSNEEHEVGQMQLTLPKSKIDYQVTNKPQFIQSRDARGLCRALVGKVNILENGDTVSIVFRSKNVRQLVDQLVRLSKIKGQLVATFSPPKRNCAVKHEVSYE